MTPGFATTARRAPVALRCAVAIAALALPGAAQAHVELVRSTPPEGAVAAEPPPRIALRFTAPVLEVVSAEVRAPSGADLVSSARVDPSDARRVVIDVRGAAAGPYRVAWAVTASDGHAVSGDLRFRVAPRPRAAEPASAQEPSAPEPGRDEAAATDARDGPDHGGGAAADGDGDDGAPVALGAAAAGAVLVGGAAIVLVRRRRGT